MRLICFGLALVLAIGFSSPAMAFLGIFDSHIKVSPVQNEVSINVSDLKAGEAKFYRMEENGMVVRFFVVRDKQNTVRVALDACDVCWHGGKGYKLDKSAMVCINCGMKFPLARIGLQKGGCNPHPVSVAQRDSHVIINAQELLSGANYFPENRR